MPVAVALDLLVVSAIRAAWDVVVGADVVVDSEVPWNADGDESGLSSRPHITLLLPGDETGTYRRIWHSYLTWR